MAGASRDLLLELVIKAVDLATGDIESVNEKVKELASALGKSEFTHASEDMQSFGDAVKAATDPLAQATAKTLALNTAIVGLAGVLAGRAYDSAKSYESTLADLAKVIDGGMDSAKQYGARLNETATQFAQNGEAMVTAMTNFVQAGYDAEEAFNLVADSTKLMIAGELSAAQSSDLLVSILKGFKAPASEATATVDLLNEVSNKYATNVEQLAIGMAAISPIAKTMNFTMAETAGLLTPVIEVYRSGSEAADALKTGLQQLTANSGAVKAALASIGVAQTDLNGQLRSGRDIFYDVARAFIGLSDAQRGYLTQELVGVEQAGRMSQVLSNLGKVIETTTVGLNSSGSAMREVETRLGTAEAAGQRADEAFRQLSVTLGNAFKPQIQGVVAATGDLAAAFDKSVKAGDLAPLLNVLKPQIAAVENLIRAMADNLDAALASVDWRPLVDGLKAVSGELGEAFAKLTEGMDLTTVEGLRNLLQALINLLGNFSQFVAGAVDGLQPLLGALNTLFGIVAQSTPTMANLAGEISGLATSVNQIVPFVTQFGGALFGVLGTIAETALKIGLLVTALKLLSAAGIPVIPILGQLVQAFLALNPAVASAAAALAGFPGLVTALVAGAGALGYGIGTLINQFVEWASGGHTVGSMLADLVDRMTGLNDQLLRNATAEELAIARQQRLAREEAARAKALEDAAKAEEEARQKSEATAAAQEKKLQLAAAEEETLRRLEEQYAAMGLVYDRATGQILRQGEATLQQKQQARELGTALEKVGAGADIMADQITAAGQETLATFRKITNNAQATATQINAAFRAAIAAANTEAEVREILKAYEEWAKGATRGAADVAQATRIAALRNGELRLSVDSVADAYKVLGITSSAILKQQADSAQLAYERIRDSGTATAAEIIKAYDAAQKAAERFRNAQSLLGDAEKNGTAGTRENTGAIKDNTAAVDANAGALNKNAKEAEANAGAAKSLAGFVKQLRDEVAALSEQALAAFERKMTNIGQTISAAGFRDLADDVGLASAAITDLQKHVEDAQAAFRYNFNNALFASGLGQYMDALKAAQAEVIALYYQQRVGVEQLKESLDGMTKSGAVDMGTLKLAVEATNGAFSLLKDQDLDALRQSIDAANESLRKMKEEAQSAQDRIAELNAEIAQEKGDTATADRLRLELEQRQALAEVEAALAQARLEQNQELIQLYEVQKQKLLELYDLKERNLKQENAAAKPTTGGAATPPNATGGGAGVSGGGGISITVNANNAKLLDQNFVADLARQLQPELSRMTRLSA